MLVAEKKFGRILLASSFSFRHFLIFFFFHLSVAIDFYYYFFFRLSFDVVYVDVVCRHHRVFFVALVANDID